MCVWYIKLIRRDDLNLNSQFIIIIFMHLCIWDNQITVYAIKGRNLFKLKQIEKRISMNMTNIFSTFEKVVKYSPCDRIKKTLSAENQRKNSQANYTINKNLI